MLRTIMTLVLALTLALPAQASTTDALVERLLNSVRSGRGLPTLQHNPELDRAAEAHAQDMAANGFFSHEGSDGSHFDERARRSGYAMCYGAENIAYGNFGSHEVVFQGWMNSSGHRRNIEHPHVREFGYAMVGGYWVMELGSTC